MDRHEQEDTEETISEQMRVAIWEILLYAAVNRMTINGTCNELESVPSGNTVSAPVREALGDSRAEVVALEERLNTALHAQLPRRIERRLEKLRFELAMDVHEIPYHGQAAENEEEVFHWLCLQLSQRLDNFERGQLAAADKGADAHTHNDQPTECRQLNPRNLQGCGGHGEDHAKQQHQHARQPKAHDSADNQAQPANRGRFGKQEAPQMAQVRAERPHRAKLTLAFVDHRQQEDSQTD